MQSDKPLPVDRPVESTRPAPLFPHDRLSPHLRIVEYYPPCMRGNSQRDRHDDWE